MPDAHMEDAYDPDQNEEEKRQVRKTYRDLTKRLDEGQTNMHDVTADGLADIIREADDNYAKVRAPQEATLDSQVLLAASKMGAQKARAMKSGAGAFDVDEFVAKLITYMGGKRTIGDDGDVGDGIDEDEYLDWDKIGRKAMAKSRRVPVMSFMLGPLSIEQKKRAPIKRAKLERNEADRKKPQEIREEDIQRAENETTKNVIQLEKILGEEGRVNLFRFVVNPQDFAQSVENIFYLSFLIRDGKVAFEYDEDTQEPFIYACSVPEEEDYAQGLRKQQLVLEFDVETWRRSIEVFNITKSMVPQRPAAKTKLGDKWYG
ncbi:Nse4 C-terminal-domain-containing protein [Schizophyllum amplum]|uniref:Non-structural maintenance of chromosomes element 4 n=1 Tax=Schizophyllum amplum TaxID=97359 RepID=A0A550CYY3_9AGAR|nr:Nse4 C-terminal-domain-containing protein [Auriculariopsis ampla]